MCLSCQFSLQAMMAEDQSETAPLIKVSSKTWGSESGLNYGTSKDDTKKTVSNEHLEVETNLGTTTNKSSTISLGSDANYKKISQVNVEFLNFDRITLTWLDIGVNVPSESGNVCQPYLKQRKRFKPLGRKQILKDITGVALPGRLMALMGAR